MSGYYPKENILDTDCFDKLGHLEDFEEKIGCPLEILLGIMLKKITEITVNYSDAGGYGSIYTEYVNTYIDGFYDDLVKGWVMETNLGEIPLKDYNINWFLRR